MLVPFKKVNFARRGRISLSTGVAKVLVEVCW